MCVDDQYKGKYNNLQFQTWCHRGGLRFINEGNKLFLNSIYVLELKI